MKLLRILIAASLLLALLCACGEQQAPDEPAQEAAPTPPEPEQTEPAAEEPAQVTIDGGDSGEEMTVIKDSADGQPLLTAYIMRPNVDGLVDGAAKKAIDRYYDDLLREEKDWWTGGLVDFARENKKAAADFGGDFLPFTIYATNEVVYDGGAFLSIRRDTEMFTGGAHGSHIVACDNFRKADGSKVQLAELFRDEAYQDLLVQQIEEHVETQGSGGDYYDNWTELLASNFDENSFSIGAEALTIYYQEYDIAPYAAGTQSFPVSYSAISNQLSEPFLRDIYGGKK